jgi:malonate transporter
MQHIFFSILPIFLITMLGAVIKRYWLTSDEFWRSLEKLSYFVLFPSVLFNYISTADISSGSLMRLVFGLMLSSILAALGLVIYQKHTKMYAVEFTSVFQGSIRYNSYIFFALGSSLYGTDGLAVVSVISAYMIIFTNAISVLTFHAYIKNETETSILPSIIRFLTKFSTNPLIISSIAGFIFNYLDLKLNIGLKNTLNSLSNAAFAMGLIGIGSGLKFTFNNLYINRIVVSGIIKLCTLPLITSIVLFFLGIHGMQKDIGILYSALPCASTAYILSKQLGGDADLMASIITTTTVLSVFSLSLVMYLLG